ncbi:MAG: MFS transporter [Bacteroidales bacterium]|nr:MFS transporter [Bacteroidales bacterium]
MSFLSPPAHKPRIEGDIDGRYSALRWQVFIGAFIGYAAFYIVRKNFSMAIPMLADFDITKGDLGLALGANAVAYALSKFLMGSVSDRSDARKFLPLGLILASIAMAFMVVPITGLDLINHPERRGLAITLMAVLNFLVGWFNGMGWPPCGRVMTHWFSQSERGTWMSVWNCAHNVGGGLVGPMATYGAVWFGSMFYGQNEQLYFLAGTYLFPAATAFLIAILAYLLLRDNPQSCGLPSIEEYRNDYPANYSAKSEEVLPVKEIFMKHVFSNRLLWFIAISNAFVYMVRYGCLDWAPTMLSDKGIDIKSAGWAYFAYEYAAIPGTIICGIVSDKIFHGKRAMPTVIFMTLVALFIGLYWYAFNMSDPSLTLIVWCMIGIGFFIYGPVMLIGVQALDLAPKNAAGTAAGFTGFFGYFFGTAILANWLVGVVADTMGWDATFGMLLVACVLSIVFMLLTVGKEQK